MKNIIRLKDTNIIGIYTDNSVDTDYSGCSCEYDICISVISFTFENGERFSAEIADVDFCMFVEFFYGNDYSNIGYKEFCYKFIEYFDIEKGKFFKSWTED